jgi:hypothetical protein
VLPLLPMTELNLGDYIAVFTLPVIVKLQLEKTAFLHFIVAASCAF